MSTSAHSGAMPSIQKMLENAMVLGAWPYDQEFAPEPENPCPHCGCETTTEEYAIKHSWVCEDCFDNYVTGLTRTEIADLMGIDWRVK